MAGMLAPGLQFLGWLITACSARPRSTGQDQGDRKGEAEVAAEAIRPHSGTSCSRPPPRVLPAEAGSSRPLGAGTHGLPRRRPPPPLSEFSFLVTAAPPAISLVGSGGHRRQRRAAPAPPSRTALSEMNAGDDGVCSKRRESALRLRDGTVVHRPDHGPPDPTNPNRPTRKKTDPTRPDHVTARSFPYHYPCAFLHISLFPNLMLFTSAYFNKQEAGHVGCNSRPLDRPDPTDLAPPSISPPLTDPWSLPVIPLLPLRSAPATVPSHPILARTPRTPVLAYITLQCISSSLLHPQDLTSEHPGAPPLGLHRAELQEQPVSSIRSDRRQRRHMDATMTVSRTSCIDLSGPRCPPTTGGASPHEANSATAAGQDSGRHHPPPPPVSASRPLLSPMLHQIAGELSAKSRPSMTCTSLGAYKACSLYAFVSTTVHMLISSFRLIFLLPPVNNAQATDGERQATAPSPMAIGRFELEVLKADCWDNLAPMHLHGLKHAKTLKQVFLLADDTVTFIPGTKTVTVPACDCRIADTTRDTNRSGFRTTRPEPRNRSTTSPQVIDLSRPRPEG
ncbi:hypothetical protein HU200_048880 [Digitaria exilis]|uniref:Uncharacterized protein n=1 Tax=Digitaria exilis TaxID=1010633 RepID=A0A835AUD4_9POAL|nr:hypothetical protein HU200_048880 [Digitaria exilis]